MDGDLECKVWPSKFDFVGVTGDKRASLFPCDVDGGVSMLCCCVSVMEESVTIWQRVLAGLFLAVGSCVWD